VRSRRGIGVPSITMRSEAVTLSAGEAIVAPLTDTRPAAIQASASRREASPARAMTLAMRSPDLSFWVLPDMMAFFVMPGLVPGIHVFIHEGRERRGWPGQARP